MSSPQGEESAAPWAACMDAEASHPYPVPPEQDMARPDIAPCG
jgi:hypothetical protein